MADITIKKIKDFLMRTDLNDILPSDVENSNVATLTDQETLLKSFQEQTLKVVRDFKQTFESEKRVRLELEKAYFQTIIALSKAVERRDTYTGGHAERVTRYADFTAEELGLSPESREEIKLAALLHDIGKISVPDNILSKESQLSSEEFEIMKTHPQNGVEIIKNIHLLERLIPSVLFHHESFDGSGYPHGLSKFDIPLGARIIAVVDTFDAIVSSRPYRKGKSPEAGLIELRRCAGTQFDPEIVLAFTQAWKSGKIIYRASR
ncbi:MAG: HD-GYP domain-containing protein [Nitrospirae bacterium]|nr:HD-GYP domain-containing protein [Nitrospirota bacterium]MBI3604502.1 HD-GYP domain-containing protein [Nitrospirota bacterium]